MAGRETLWRAVRWPLVLIVIASIGVGVAFLLDQTSGRTREWALTIGAPSLTFLLPGGVLWLLIAVIAFTWRRRRRREKPAGPET
ncbi:MAG TPA: hypothetical protein VE709_07210 [Pseudonocardiaceae bacterium]|jgi:hypothetical protein|nr:hypothetical protein [Pseudonocardiaceae bacterium]